MGKKRKNKDRVDPTLPPEEKVAKLVEKSAAKVENREWAAAENFAKQAVAECREHFNRDEDNILHARSNLQLGRVSLKQGHFAQARKPIDTAQRVAEANSDLWLKSEVYALQADLCFMQKKKNNGMHDEGKKWREKQWKEEEKARRKDLAAGPTYAPPPPAQGMVMGLNPYMQPPPQHLRGMMLPPQGGPYMQPPMPQPQHFPPHQGYMPVPNLGNRGPPRGPVPVPVPVPVAAAAPAVAASQPASSSPEKPATTKASENPAAKGPSQQMIWAEDSDVSMEEKRAQMYKAK
ncbi:hypothetical protein HOP50_02g10410 [Chloropicon primus]|uniref:Uncharacterized protein n=1 Tax=Chloropicon primus TaxID=1764295 RepID=A0A5B8MDS1_9CHLO|nr:hypothetical protein A3770_02p10550 [Chloropicon primus]UPQ97746.1 hypothetical protein HOP50_02g10410 [Chloropicon primus]|eukprot:QDZ18537.1 hypothetical protein A3770_02p10550 [Chloropicon primus]